MQTDRRHDREWNGYKHGQQGQYRLERIKMDTGTAVISQHGGEMRAPHKAGTRHSRKEIPADTLPARGFRHTNNQAHGNPRTGQADNERASKQEGL